MVVEFSVNDDPTGHHYDNYERGLQGMGDEAASFVDDATAMYMAGGGGMQTVHVKLPDKI